MCISIMKIVRNKLRLVRGSPYRNHQQQRQQQQLQLQELQQQQQRSASSSSSSVRRRRPKPSTPYITIHYGQETPFQLKIPENQHYHNITVKDIKELCKAKLSIPLCTMKIQYNGGYLNNDTATLESLGIPPRTSVIVVFGDRVTEQQLQEMGCIDLEEFGACQIIKNAMNECTSLQTRVIGSDQQQQNEDEQRQHRIQELNQTLVTLDSVECPRQFQTACRLRRDAIRQCQHILNQMEDF